MSKLLDMVPVVNKDNKELMSLYNIHKEELEKVELIAKEILKNLFVLTADVKGVEEYEKMLGITGVGTLQARKNNILLKLVSRPPYTESALWKLCTAIYGEGRFDFTVYADMCALVFEAFVDNPEDFTSFNKELRYIIPANICLVYLLQYVYKWLTDNMTYRELTENQKYTYAELSRYSSFYASSKRATSILERIIKYSYYYLSHNLTYKELTENELYTYAELSRLSLVEYLYSYLHVNNKYKQVGLMTYRILSRNS